MDFTSKKTLWKFITDESTNDTNSLQRFSIENDETNSHPTSARTSCVSAASTFPLFPASPETPWTRSPANISPPSQPLLYHCLASLHRSEGTIFSLALTKDFIFTGSASSRIYASKLPNCTETGHIKASSGEVRATLSSEKSKSLFTTHKDCRIRVWDLSNLKKTATLPPRRSFFTYRNKNVHQHKKPISCLAYSDKEKLLYTGSWDHTVKVWKIAEKRCVDSFIAHEGKVNAIVINQEDGFLFTCSSDGTVKIWRRVSTESSHILTITLKFQPSPINALALSLSSGTCFLYSGSSDGLVNFWEKERISGRYNHGGFLQGHQFAVLCLTTIRDLILSGSDDATIRIWRREECNYLHSCLAVIDGHHGPVKCLAAGFERGEIVKGLLVYSASLDQTMKVWRVKVCGEERVEKGEMEGEDLKMECKMSPVLSPLWVEKKIQGDF